jgi:hypothetical protein
MPNENSSEGASADSKDQPPSERPASPLTPQKDELRKHSDSSSHDENKKAVQLEKDIRSGERWLIGISAAGVILNLAIALIYYGQLKEMRKSTRASAKAADAAASAADTEAKNQADEAIKEVNTMRESNRINREALESVQRAFVLPGDVDPTVIGNNSTQSVRFSFRWNNSGTTPTKGLRTHVNYRWDVQELPIDFPFSDLWEEGRPHVQTPALLGPKASTAVDVGPVPAQVVNGVVQHYYHLNFWGWARYRDVFRDTPEHLTEFCYELIPFDVQIGKDSTTIKYRLDNCTRHNCYDNECKEEK